MRHIRRSRKKSFARWFSAAPTPPLRKAPRRRSVEQLEPRHLMTATPGTNPLFADQWHLFSDGQLVEQPDSPFYNQSIALDGQDINALAAWALGYTGAGVQVGIVDSGFDLSHEDLVFRNDLAIDLLNNDSDPSFTDPTDAHGTLVAGVIGARDNTVGGLGLAHSSDLVPIRLLAGQFDLAPATTVDMLRAAFLYRAGTIAQQQQGDLLPEDIIDVYNHSWGWSGPDRSVQPLGGSDSDPITQLLIREAIQESVLTGRARYLGDADGDGVRDPEEFEALGAIHVVAAGNESGNSFSDVFGSIGGFRSSQYGELANSRYTIAVGAIDFDGEYENPQVGSVTGWAETGSNVLIVAPSAVIQIENGNVVGTGGGIRTTDPTGEAGSNIAPVEIFPGTEIEVDGDFLVDTNYSSTFNGTSAAAPQVSATVALMLEANPDLNWREVQQILMMSARQNDQFSETWVTNPFQLFQDNYVIPQYAYYDFSTSGDGTVDIEDGIIPNTIDADIIRGLYTNNPDAALPLAFDPASLIEFTMTDLLEDPGDGMEPPVFLEIVGSTVPEGDDGSNVPDPPGLLPPQPNNVLANPISIATNPQAATVQTPLYFTNGAGYTVSQGYGYYLEEIGYAHGVLDAGLAVELAKGWADNSIGLTEEVSVTSFVQGATGSNFRVQPAALIDLGENVVPDFKVPGGISVADINPAYYQEFFKDFTTETVETFDMSKSGDIITDGPWYNPNGDLNIPNRKADTLVPFTFDSDLLEDFVSIESIELRTQINGGDIDNLRITLISPDGTQTELNPFRENSGQGPRVYQNPLGQQGKLVPPDEVLPGGSENYQVGAVTTFDALDSGEPWTWTTNRHWGELISIQGNGDATTSLNDTWFLSFENWGLSEALIADEFAITVHGTRATGSRIQGKIGVDDNAQGITGYDNDQNFNFERNLEFGQISYLDSMMNVVTLDVVLDDQGDSVYHDTSNPQTDRIYRTRNTETGADEFYAVVDRDAYFGTDDPGADADSLLADVNNFLVARDVTDLPTSVVTSFTADTDGRAFSSQDFDYSQESFAAGVTVVATQLRTVYDAAGNASVAQPTGVTQKFITGADGNYYFDVEATPTPPDPSTQPAAYADWFVKYGETFTYEISLEGEGVGDRIIERSYTSVQNRGIGDPIFNASGGSSSYTVPIFASQNVESGATSIIQDVNFLLAVDPAESNGVVDGQVFVDYNNNGVFDTDDVAASGVMVTLTYTDSSGTQSVTAFTDESGNYELVKPDAGAGEIVDVAISSLPAGFSPLNPADGDQDVSLVRGDRVTADFTLNLDGAAPGQAALVTGVVFEDINGNGVQDAGEGPLSGVRVYADGTGGGSDNNVYDAGEVVATTNASGAYTLAFTTGGSYELRIDFADASASGFQQTTPTDGASGVNNGAPLFVSAVAGSTVGGSLFGLQGATLDFGDLAGYGSAQHVVIPSVRLGDGVSAELQQLPSSEETFDDGVTMVANPIEAGGTIEFIVDPNFQGASLNAWIDFDNNGVFDADEQIFTNLGLDTQSSDTVTVSATVNADLDTSASLLAARFRWGPFNLGPYGLAISGEVEDYLLYADPMSTSAASYMALTDNADYNGDGRVSQADYTVWQSSFGLTGPLLTADGNGDMKVDILDYTLWADAFGAAQLLMPMKAATPPLALATATPPAGEGDAPIAEQAFALAFATAPTSADPPGSAGDDAVDPAANDEALLLLASSGEEAPTDPVVDPVEEGRDGEEERKSRRQVAEDRFAERRVSRQEARRAARS